MKITPECFENGGEVDFTAHYPSTNQWPRGRLSMRMDGLEYEVYVHWHVTKKEDVLFKCGNLFKAVDYVNGLGFTQDEAASGGES